VFVFSKFGDIEMDAAQREAIVATLRGVIQVQDDGGAKLLMGDPAFWARCYLIRPVDVERFFVDGYAVACKWNSWTVAQMYPNLGLRVYQGYALSHLDGRWVEHCWLVSGNRLVETTGPFALYYGAELNNEELAEFNHNAAQYDPEQFAQGQMWVTMGPGRFQRSITEAFKMGRHRDLHGVITEGLF
jgi:hypothetical protein